MEGLRKALEGLDVDGVVSGAVWSDYQWDRMNIVCGDLGLKFIAPMWRKDQDMLLGQLIDAGIEAVIVGCYAEGFDESWLGRPIDRAAVEDLKKLDVNSCIQCGLCSYICPSKIGVTEGVVRAKRYMALVTKK